jgi:hypothetical protein
MSTCMRVELTLEGRKLAMTSLTFCVGGPAGGGGAPGVAEPAAMSMAMFVILQCLLAFSSTATRRWWVQSHVRKQLRSRRK